MRPATFAPRPGRPGPWLGGLLGLGGLLVGGCRGDLASGGTGDGSDGTTMDAGTAGGSSGGGSTGGDTNLLLNPSFEEWAGVSPLGWTPSVDLVVTQGVLDPADGSAYLQATPTAYGEVQQLVGLAAPLAAGESIAVELSYRRVEGDTTAPGVDLYGVLTSGDEVLLPVVTPPPFVATSWTTGGGVIVLPETITAVRVAIAVGGLGAQIVDLDDVRLWVP